PTRHSLVELRLHGVGSEVTGDRKDEVSRMVEPPVKGYEVVARYRFDRLFRAQDAGEMLLAPDQTIPFPRLDIIGAIVPPFDLLKSLALVKIEAILLKGRALQHVKEKFERLVELLAQRIHGGCA